MIEYYTDDMVWTIDTPQTACSVPTGILLYPMTAMIQKYKPGMVELCDGIDNNCDNAVDENTAYDASTWYLDSDRMVLIQILPPNPAMPTGYSADNTDCNDGEAPHSGSGLMTGLITTVMVRLMKAFL